MVTVDAQPASPSVASLVVLVTGQLLVDDGSNVLQFSQMFQVSFARNLIDTKFELGPRPRSADTQLIPDGGSYYVQNDVFRL